MSDNTYLCVGGPLDGKQTVLRDGRDRVIVPVQTSHTQRIGASILDGPARETVDHIEYRPQAFQECRDGVWYLTMILVPAGTSTTDALRRLIEHYKPTGG